MLTRLRESWRELKRGKPGRRFRERYERRRARPGHGGARKWLVIAGGVLAVVAGVVLLPLPGPGLVVIGAGTVLIAEQSRAVAQLLDWVERKLSRKIRSQVSPSSEGGSR